MLDTMLHVALTVFKRGTYALVLWLLITGLYRSKTVRVLHKNTGNIFPIGLKRHTTACTNHSLWSSRHMRLVRALFPRIASFPGKPNEKQIRVPERDRTFQDSAAVFQSVLHCGALLRKVAYRLWVYDFLQFILCSSYYQVTRHSVEDFLSLEKTSHCVS